MQVSKITSLNPIIISNYSTTYGDTVSVVLHPTWEPELIAFIRDNNLQIGDDIVKKQIELKHKSNKDSL